MSYLSYIADDDLKTAVKKVVDCILETQQKAEEAMYINVIDPFSAIFDGAVQGFKLDDWLKMERARQSQKTVQNQIGYFHQNILGSIPGWRVLPKGFDICNDTKQIFAEIKNKYNTVKGSDKSGIYDYLSSRLNETSYQGFTAYYVEIIPSIKEPYIDTLLPKGEEILHSPSALAQPGLHQEE